MKQKISNRDIKNAEKYVKKTNQEIMSVETISSSVDEQLEKCEDEFCLLVRDSQEELDELERQQNFITRFPIIKQKLIHLYVSGNYTIRQIGLILKISTSTVSKWLHSPDIIEAIKIYQEQESIIIDASMKALRLKAINTVSELMEGAENEMVQLMAARDILDRTGHKAVEKKEVKVELSYEERLKQIISGVDFTQVQETEFTPVEQNKDVEGENKGE